MEYERRQWKLCILNNPLPKSIVDSILSVPVGMQESESDSLIWCNTADGELTSKGVYKFLMLPDD